MSGGQVTREICLLDLAGVYRSAADAISSTAEGMSARVATPRAKLEQAHRCHVVITTRRGRVRIGRLHIGRERIELHQMIKGIPCRHRYGFDDIVACYSYSDDEWDERPTPPFLSRRDPAAVETGS